MSSGHLLDTNVVSELRKGGRADPGVGEWFASAADDGLYLSVLVIGELRLGVENLRRRDEVAAGKLDRWLTALADEYEDRILPVDLSVSEEWGRINVPDRLPVIDGLMAATALVNDLTLVTRNTSDLETSTVPTLNPFEGT